MKKLHKPLALGLIFAMFLTLIGCQTLGNEKFSVAARLETQQLCVAFRAGDRVGEAVSAALREIQAEGEVDSLSRRWFGKELSILRGNDEAISGLEFELTERDLIIGYDAGRLPFSGDEGGKPTGFDVELARLVCQKLGWNAKFLAINVGNAKTELNSGNVDCVWGAYAYDASETGLGQSPAYMENTVVIASLKGSGVRSLKSLSGKTLAVSELGGFTAILEKNKEAYSAPEYLVKLPGNSDQCFKALEEGSCDAIVTDLASLEYYK